MRARFALPLLLLTAGCADGGSEDSPPSDVKISAAHHLFGFRSLRGFGTFPVKPEVVFTDLGTLNLFDNSTYTITRLVDGQEQTSTADRYSIDKLGGLSMYVTGSSREPSVTFRGAYSLAGAAPERADLFFTDRVSTPNSPALGLYVGMRVIAGQVELAGGWHVLSLHTTFNEAILSPENVARAAHGAVLITEGTPPLTPGSLRDISGTGMQGNITTTFGGTIQNILVNNVGKGLCTLNITYDGDNRQCDAAATSDLIVGLDRTETDGEAGLIVMLRKFDAPATPVDTASIAGRFLVGGYTVFVNPSNPGSDAFVGVVTLGSRAGSSGPFKLEASGNQGIDFTYSGTWIESPDGGITITISGTNETWFAAIDRDYQTLVFVDDFRETRSNNQPELNLGFGVREKQRVD